jgi:hypothetical protein
VKSIAVLTVLLCSAAAVQAADKQAVRVVRDIAYRASAGEGDDKNKLDLYLPDGRTGVPVIVSLYGGALMQGDKNNQPFVGQRFASAGIAAAVVNYRLSPSRGQSARRNRADRRAIAQHDLEPAERGGRRGRRSHRAVRSKNHRRAVDTLIAGRRICFFSSGLPIERHQHDRHDRIVRRSVDGRPKHVAVVSGFSRTIDRVCAITESV